MRHVEKNSTAALRNFAMPEIIITAALEMLKAARLWRYFHIGLLALTGVRSAASPLRIEKSRMVFAAHGVYVNNKQGSEKPCGIIAHHVAAAY